MLGAAGSGGATLGLGGLGRRGGQRLPDPPHARAAPNYTRGISQAAVRMFDPRLPIQRKFADYNAEPSMLSLFVKNYVKGLGGGTCRPVYRAADRSPSGTCWTAHPRAEPAGGHAAEPRPHGVHPPRPGGGRPQGPRRGHVPHLPGEAVLDGAPPPHGDRDAGAPRPPGPGPLQGPAHELHPAAALHPQPLHVQGARRGRARLLRALRPLEGRRQPGARDAVLSEQRTILPPKLCSACPCSGRGTACRSGAAADEGHLPRLCSLAHCK